MSMTPFTTPLGGVMTREAGAISGDVELVEAAQGRARVRYVGAADVYTVTGGVPDGWDAAQVVAFLSADPGTDEFGNPAASDLTKAGSKSDGASLNSTT